MIDICQELAQNAIDFAYEANSQRAFPDARDGLKPGQRACLWEMYSKGYTSGKPHVKSAKIDGGVSGNWWPHGTTAIYETFARMSQPWINNIPEVSWHGSNGNIVVGPEPAADRYSEARLAKATEDGMLQGLKKNNVPMILNFSEDDEWPEVLPAIFPRLLVNGCQGIGYTIANVWLPMNLNEVGNAIIHYIQTGELDNNSVKPDFPTGGIIINSNELSVINSTGKGKVVLRGKVEVKNNSILITELPYQVYVEPFIDSIKALIQKEEIKGIKEIYNKTDKKQLLIEIECDGNIHTILNALYTKTDLQKNFNANQFALVSKTPKLLTLKDYIDIYIKHNITCFKREKEYDLKKAQERLEIVDGLIKALVHIDDIIALIKKSPSAKEAQSELIKIYSFTEIQAKAIVDMKLGRLANLETLELQQEGAELKETITNILEFLNSEEKQNNLLIEKLSDFIKKYGFARRTELAQINFKPTKEEKELEYVEPEKCVVILTKAGNIKRIPVTSFHTQRANTKGIKTQDDITAVTIRTNTIDSLMIFTNKGTMYRLLVNDIPEGTNSSKGTAVRALVSMEPGEQVETIYSVYRDTDAKYVLFVTKSGTVKKTSLDEYINTKKKTGMQAIKLREDDTIASVTLIKEEPIILLTHNGMGIKIDSKSISASGRATIGVKGITLTAEDYVVAALPIRHNTDSLAIFAENGNGLKINLKDLITQIRGGKGFIYYKGKLAGGALIDDKDQILISGEKRSVCIKGSDIPQLNRGAIGNIILKEDSIIAVTKV